MTERNLNVVVLGLSITSSWGNGHATTYRSLLRGLCELGHRVLFLERDRPWYAQNRDLPQIEGLRVALYDGLGELKRLHTNDVRDADLVIVGSYVPEGIQVGHWMTRTARGLTAFYDIDTPITLTQLETGHELYLSRSLVPRYGLYLSFTGGPALETIERKFGSPLARALYCAADPGLYYPQAQPARWDLAYMGTYSSDRQPALERLLLSAARERPQGEFAVVGPQYPDDVVWPDNVERIQHLAPEQHRGFYNRQRFTLNVTRAEMRRSGYSPSVRLFEAAACGTPIITDPWPGLESVFEPGRELLIAHSTADVIEYLKDLPDDERRTIGARARKRVMESHTGLQRALDLLRYVREARSDQALQNTAQAQ